MDSRGRSFYGAKARFLETEGKRMLQRVEPDYVDKCEGNNLRMQITNM